jgi:hypothetical protein
MISISKLLSEWGAVDFAKVPLVGSGPTGSFPKINKQPKEYHKPKNASGFNTPQDAILKSSFGQKG